MSNRHTPLLAAALLLALGSAVHAQTTPPADPEFPPQPPVLAKTPQEEARTFQLPPGYRMELVLSEPDIAEPVCMAFDGDGRLYVAEMRAYMQDIDGTDEHAPVSRVSVHWSSKNDGIFDQHRIFADKLVLPRLLLPLDDGVLIGETDTNDLYLHRDTNGDGVSDEKHRVYEGGDRGGNLEHQPSGLTWALDNWLYSAVNNYRLRWQDGQLIKQDIPGNGGQWGATQDDHGKFWVVNAGGERGPVNFQNHILYGQFSAPNQFEPGFEIVWPAMGLRDFQGGPPKSRDDNTLNHFTATCGGEIYRGDRLPSELRGNLFFGEPVGRLVRRTTIEVQDGTTILHNPYPQSEFLRSTDACFRPIDMKTAPDGTLFIADMYRGIIQEGNWTREGSYLRKVIQQYAMDKITDRGRIWRLVHESTPPAPTPKLLEATPAGLVATLAHANGWQRDTAQKLLVLRRDPSVTPALVTMLETHADPLARIHALWTLEGTGALTADHIRKGLKDEDANVRQAAIRAGETLMRAGDQAVVDDIKALARDPDPGVVIQVFLTAKLMNWKDYSKFINTSALGTPSKGVKMVATQILTNKGELPKYFSSDEKNRLTHGEAIFQELCYTCHGLDGKGTAIEGGEPNLTLAPPLSGSKIVLGPREGLVRALLHGVTGPVDGKIFQAQMIPMANNNDAWIADVLSYVRNNFGNSATLISPQEVAAARSATQSRTTPWTEEELLAQGLPRLGNRDQWKLTASNGTETLAKAVDDQIKSCWDSHDPITEKMWFTLELPSAETVAALTITSQAAGGKTRNLVVETSLDGKAWDKPVFRGNASTALSEITFTPTPARFIRITSNTQSDKRTPWRIHDIAVHTPAVEPKNG